MSQQELLIETLGWLASVLIVGSYALNLWGKIETNSKVYMWANIFGGLFFVINTYYHHAYPSMVVNLIWVIIALALLIKPSIHKK